MQIYVTQLLMQQRGIITGLSCLIKLIFYHFRPSTVHGIMSCELNLPFLSSFTMGGLMGGGHRAAKAGLRSLKGG